MISRSCQLAAGSRTRQRPARSGGLARESARLFCGRIIIQLATLHMARVEPLLGEPRVAPPRVDAVPR
eukprot:5687435-Pyramimonas_sp.AAC.1